MNDDELKKLWQGQPLLEPHISEPQLIAAMQNKMSHFRRQLRARDIRELAACAIILVIFGYFFYHEEAPIVRLGWLIVIASSVFIGGVLVHARRTTPPAAPGATLVESLGAELHSVRTQSRLLGSVLWWYLLPPGIGLLVATWGMKTNLHAKIPATLVFVATYGFVYWVNQRARAKHLLPLEAQMEALLRSAETGEQLDATHVADLHPIARSMAAAGHVTPAQFNVAFWQIALYAEIAFLGFWIVLPASTMPPDPQNGFVAEYVARLLNWRHVAWFVPAFLGGLLFSWMIKKAIDGAVGISAEGIHLVKGQKLLLWDEIKVVRPFRFLNIRSLWLIDDSGAKMIMPWTSLERHSELKAMVEKFAPASHPLRQYLPLLKRK